MKGFIVGVSMVAALSVAGNANALVIDNFDGGAQSVSAPGTNTVSYSAAVGGFRTVNMASPGPLTATASVIPGAAPLGIYAHSADALTPATSTITWDANGAGLGGVDFVEGLINNTFSFDIVSIDQGFIDLILTVEDTLSNSASYTFSGAGTGVQTVAFTNFSGIDFTSVNMLSLQVKGGAASDLTLDLFATTGEQPPLTVPEPGVLLLLGAGLLGMAGMRRRSTSQSV